MITNASGKDGRNMKEMTISAVRCREKPKYSTSAKQLLEKARAFYQDPENEKAFLDWMKERGEKKCSA